MSLLKQSDIAAALSIEAQRGIIDAFDERLHVIRPHRGQLDTAYNMRNLLAGSTYVTHQGQLKVQDAYCLRCVPQIHGASKDALGFVKDKVDIEINAATDNPIVLPDGDVISGGNFHGEPMALPFDFLGIGISEIANVSERRLERLINNSLSGFPSFLVKHSGLNSGFMITQYAAAALVSENKVLAHPASVDSIPSCENQEDLVSMGAHAARKAGEIAFNARRVVATEILAACQAIDLREGEGFKLGAGTQAAYDAVRKTNDFIAYDKDIEMFKELEKITKLVQDGGILDAVEDKVDLKFF